MRLPATIVIALTAASILGACSTARDVEGEVATCTTCHGSPPAQLSSGAAHPQNPSCFVCHADTVDANGQIIPGGAHKNGQVDATGGHDVPFVAQHTAAALADLASCRTCHGDDYAGGTSGKSCTACHQATVGAGDWRTNCTFCHGGGAAGRDAAWDGTLSQAAPPQSVKGPAVEADQTSANPKVGAHQRHLVAGTYSAALPCTTCHAVPLQTFPESLEHVNGSAAIAFSALARQGVATPGYAGGSCAVYCHGSGTAFEPGSNTTVAWTSTGQLTCGTCHTVNAAFGGDYGHGFHVGRSVACDKCHAGYSATGDTVDLAKHVNGTFEASVAAGTYTQAQTYGPHATPTWPSGTCTTSCHTSLPPF